MKKGVLASVSLIVIIALVLSACGGGDMGLTRAEVEEVVRTELAAVPPPTAPSAPLTEAHVEGVVNRALAEMPQPEPGLTRVEVEEIVEAAVADIPQPQPGLTTEEAQRIARAAVADIPQPQPGLTTEEAERIARAAIADIPQPQPGLTTEEAQRIARAVVADIPPRSVPADYTKFLVENAISRYQAHGLDATLAHYNRPESTDGQWYVFIIDENDLVIGHPDPERLGLDLKDWVGTDANGYNFGPDMLSATEEGKWVSYVYRNPESGGIGSDFEEFELKNAWVMKHDGLLFGSGWYIDAAEFTRMLVSVAVDRFREGGLAATVAYFASPGSALAGLEEAIAYYNNAETVDGQWFAFIGDPAGKIAAHSNPLLIGRDVQELFDAETFAAAAEGNWVESESVRVWVMAYDGYVFGSGWSRD